MTDSPDQPDPPLADPALLSPLELAEVLTNLPDGSTLHFKKVAGGFAVSTAVAGPDVPKKTKADLLEEDRYRPLKGVGVTLSEAAKKCEVPRDAVESWVYGSRNVSFVDEAAYPKLIDLAEVTLCADIYKKRKNAGGLTGFPFFDEQGYLVEAVKHPDRAAKRRLKQAA